MPGGPVHRVLIVSLLTITLVACGSGEPDPTDPADTDVDTDTAEVFPPGPDLPAGTAGAFALVADGERTDIVWEEAADNLVFCRIYDGTEAWIRLAAEATADGENVPHLDIDVCAWDGTGAYEPQSASVGRCSGARTFDITWVGEQNATWANAASSTDCTLELTSSGEQVEGSFSCRGLAPVGEAEGTVDVRNGRFRCTPVEG